MNYFLINNRRMSIDVNWDVERYRDEHESEEHWKLRKDFMEKWKKDYPEERLVCLARAYSNMELMGCRYPLPVMEEVCRLSFEVGQAYRNIKRTRLKRTFVSASSAAEDRAKGIKRQGGVIITTPPKSKKIEFVAQGHSSIEDDDDEESLCENIDDDATKTSEDKSEYKTEDKIEDPVAERTVAEHINIEEFINEMNKINCIQMRDFKEYMFNSSFGRLVLLIRPWARKLWNIQNSCQACGLNQSSTYEDRVFTMTINGHVVAQATGDTKTEAKNLVELMVWERLRKEVISILMKEQFISQGNTISVSDVSGNRGGDVFGTPVENSVAVKMMQMMGWKGGGLGVDSQGIAEPIKPNMQMVNRAGLGSSGFDARHFRRAAQALMQRFLASQAFDLDLVFSSDFSKDERAMLHQCAKRVGLASRSYGDKDRFLVVKKKLDPFSIARAVIEEGGETTKYQVFIPAILRNGNR